MRCFNLVVLSFLLASCALAPSARESPLPSALALRNVTVIDATGAAPQANMTVVITGDRIRAIGPTGAVAIPRGARVIDATGQFLIPGLWDMHVHLTAAGVTDFPLFVAQGVTGVRDMGGTWDVIHRWQERIKAGEIVGPRVKTAGPIVENARWLEGVRSIPEGRAFLEENPRLGVGTVEEARSAVDSLARLGVDFIKLRNAPPRAAYFALVEEARKRDLPVVGHMPRGGLGFLGAIEAGQAGIEHLDVLADELDGVPESERRALFARMAEREIWYAPTLVSELKRLYPSEVVGAIVEDSLGQLDPRRRYVSEPLLEFWRVQQNLDKYETPKDWGPVFARALGYAREMRRADVPMLAGTDFGARLVYPGWSLHDELALLVEHAGLSPLEALQAATRNAARFFNAADEFGTVEAGKWADLILLGADPLQDIRNTQRINAVVLGGQLLARDRLDQLQAQARRAIER